MSQGCSKVVPRMFKGVTRVFLKKSCGCFKGDLGVFHRGFKDVSWMFQGCFKGISRMV